MKNLIYLADFDPNIKNQINNLKNKTGAEEAGKLLQKDAVGGVQWVLFGIMLLAILNFAVQAKKHDWKKSWWSIAVAVVVAVIAYMILPALA